MVRAVQVTTKHSIAHVIARRFSVSVEFLDRRWWELRPRMRVTIPIRDIRQLIYVQKLVLWEASSRGYSPGIHIKMTNVELN